MSGVGVGRGRRGPHSAVNEEPHQLTCECWPLITAGIQVFPERISVTAREINEVLTEILSDVQQDLRGSSVQLVKERAEAEEEECSHAETITAQGKSQRQRKKNAALSVVSFSDVIRDLVVAVKGTAAEILHHLLLTKRRGKSPIRLRKVKLVSLGSLEADGDAPTQLRSDTSATE